MCVSQDYMMKHCNNSIRHRGMLEIQRMVTHHVVSMYISIQKVRTTVIIDVETPGV